MKRFTVNYHTITYYDAVVRAKNTKEAKEKVAEVIGDPLDIDDVYELKDYTPHSSYRSNPNA